ncbi:thiamine phosphate synthase [Waterburya agarophytonicola K14]|uniref:Thiamine-phosphate synthase n=1 Tax=Waterburya agarophytonicola KI4 TaxID=2874699 RepID=A0A964BQ57_9CYAN|nr:thiamine phosphate synthase [Waterburya agarophytonicola]MCC0176812.1 thiamine phosphate synthase [Waterburya agarophytonicola KI4]
MNKAIYRILDANLDRAREGLRIIEEWCRLGLNHKALAEECKQIRQELAQWHSWELRQARDTPGDVGTELSHPQEEARESIEQLLQANLCRSQEALRVLEEYSKLYDPEMASACKQIRYRVYTIESTLFNSYRHQLLHSAPLYLVTSPEPEILKIVEAALKGGLNLVQYRDKDGKDSDRLEMADKLCQLCHHYNALFIVNDRVDIALAVDADGVHLGQNDAPVAFAREILGMQKIVGRSTTNKQELNKAISEKADYVGVGPFFETPTKPGKAALTQEYVDYVKAKCSVPWFAIGGIDLDNLNGILTTGAQRVSVVRAIMQAEQPTQVTRQFLSQLVRR